MGRRLILRGWINAVCLFILIALLSNLGGVPVRAGSAEQIHPRTDILSSSAEPALPSDVTRDWWTAVQADILRSEYRVSWQARTGRTDAPAAYQAPNRVHNLRTTFTSAGVRVVPRVLLAAGAGWEWGLTLSRYGYPGRMRPVEAAAGMHAAGARFEYRYPRSAITEWYVNDERGLEQGFTLYRPPQGKGKGALILALTLSGDLVPQLTADGVTFITPWGVRALDYGALHVTDAAGRALPARLDLAPDGGTLIIAVAAARARYPLTVDPLIVTPAWMAESDQAGAIFGTAAGMAGDVNGDGYSDIIVGAPAYDNGQVDEGRAFIYPGSPHGPKAVPIWTAEGDQDGAGFGTAAGTAGDVNGDTYPDVIVGAPAFDNGEENEGRIFVYYGSAAGPLSVPAWTYESDQAGSFFGFAVSTAGDVNGDGYADVMAAAPLFDNGHLFEGIAYVYHGSAAGLSATPVWQGEGDQTNAYYGYALGTAGDVNRDGYDDIIIGAFLYDHDQVDEGRAFVYHGSAAGLSRVPAWTAEGDQNVAALGEAVGTAGDVNGDGYDDVIVGAGDYDEYDDDGDRMNVGRAFVYLGSAYGLSITPVWVARGDRAEAFFGGSVGTAGDVDADGYADVIVGAPYYDGDQVDEGKIFVYRGSAEGPDSTPAWTAEGNQQEAHLGSVAGTAGDVDGDGAADLIAGAPNYDHGQEDEGRVFVYFGLAGGLDPTPAWTAEGDQVGALFGWSVGTAGDVNGDGYSDVIVGAPDYDAGQENEGRAFVYHGSIAGLSPAPAWTAEGNQAEAHFGIAVGTAGDVNGDGFSDTIVGAMFYDAGQQDEGRAFVYHGSADGLDEGPAWTAERNQERAYFGYAVGTAGDVNGDGYADVIVGAPNYRHGQVSEGGAFVYHGSDGGLAALPAWTAESNQARASFGQSVGTAGDVNGDGYDDVIVGADLYDAGQADEGRAFVYHGSDAGLFALPAWTAESNRIFTRFGWSAGTAGDVNGDGYSDVIVGAFYYSNPQGVEGAAFAYYGSAAGLSYAPDWKIESNQAEALLGSSVGTAGDVNGDGYSDVIVGAASYDHGERNEGAAFVYRGSAAGLLGVPIWMAESDQAEATFGWSAGTAGDVNGDGYSDVIVGAYLYYRGELNEGRAFVYHGRGGGLSPSGSAPPESEP